jgi:hypothetical protein
MMTSQPAGQLRSVLPFLILAAFSVSVPLLRAQEARQCQIVVQEILAENTGQGLDDALKSLKKDLEKLNYSTYRLSNTHELNVKFSESGNLTLLGDNKLTLTAEGLDENGKIRLKVKLSPRDSKAKSLDMVLRIPDGGTFLIGGPNYGQGALILAFTAKL